MPKEQQANPLEIQWENVDRPLFKFESVGDVLVGRLDRIRSTESKFGQTTAADITEAIANDNGKLYAGTQFTILCSAVLARQLAAIEPGELVKVTYTGEGENQVKFFDTFRGGKHDLIDEPF